MQNEDTKNTPVSSGNAPHAEHDQALLRFARRLDMHHDLEGLLRALPAELSSITVCNTAALFFQYEATVSWHVAEMGDMGDDITRPLPSVAEWQQTILPLVYGAQRELVFSSLDQETRFPETTKFFRRRGNESLCVLPLNTGLHRLGTICFGRRSKNSFSENEVCFLSLVADYVGLAIDDRLNFARSETARIELERERTKLKLILDLNNSLVSNLELRDVLQSISPSIRDVMRLDGVALILPDAEKKLLQTHALDFPLSKGSVRQDMSSPLYGSLPGQVFRSGKPWVGNIGELQESGLDHRIAAEEGVETMCMLPH